MNTFIYQFDEQLTVDGFITSIQESELIQHIFDGSSYTSVEEFTTANISYDDALELVQSDDQFTSDATDYLSNQPNGLSDAVMDDLQVSDKSVTDLAYTLAYDHPELGSKLLTELLYYRNQFGRI